MRVSLDGSGIGDDRPQVGQRGTVPRSPDTSMGVRVNREAREDLGGARQEAPAEFRVQKQPKITFEPEVVDEGLTRVTPSAGSKSPDPQQPIVMFELNFPHASGPIHIQAQGYTVDVKDRKMNFYSGGNVCAEFRIPEGIWWGIILIG